MPSYIQAGRFITHKGAEELLVVSKSSLNEKGILVSIKIASCT
jgi:hypothetical protein